MTLARTNNLQTRASLLEQQTTVIGRALTYVCAVQFSKILRGYSVPVCRSIRLHLTLCARDCCKPSTSSHGSTAARRTRINHKAAPRMADAATRAKHLCDFLEVATHTILKERNLYPAEIFSDRRCFGVPVSIARHPEVEAYVKKTLKAIEPLLASGSVEAVVIAVTDGTHGEPVEKFVFRVDPTGPPPSDAVGGPHDVADAVESTEYSLRALLARLALLDTKLPPVREDAAWRLLLWMREGYDASQILADPAAARLVDATRDLSAAQIKDASLVPVKTVATPLAHFELYVECEGP